MSVNANEMLNANEKMLKKFKDKLGNAKALQDATEEEFFNETAFQRSIQERGASYIKAAKLIVENTPDTFLKLKGWQKESIQSKLEELAWEAPQNTDKKQALLELETLLGKLCAVIEPCIENPNLDKLMKNLNNAENHVNWKTRGTLETIIELKNDKGVTDYVQFRIDEPITRFTTEQEKEWTQILTEGKEPKWFKQLASWEQKYFKAKVSGWKTAQNSNPTLNLGDFMGVPPTTIRGYPGARNGYKSHVYTCRKGDNGELYLFNHVSRIRSGHISPSKMKSRRERLKAAEENIKQLILAGIENAIENAPVENPQKTDFIIDLQTLITPPFTPADNEMDLDRLTAVDNLRTQFKKAGAFGKFLEENLPSATFKKLPSTTTTTPTIKLITSNYPVNKFRAFSNFLAPLKAIPGISHIAEFPALIENLRRKDPISEKLKSFGKWLFSAETYYFFKRAVENNRTLSVLNQEEKAIEKKKLGAFSSNELMGSDALKKIKEISGPMRRLVNFFTRGINHNAERAALEQIAASGLGVIRIGSCMSGKDREGAVSEHVAAMGGFYAQYGEFPPIPPFSKISKELQAQYPKKTSEDFRKEYEEMVAKEFLSGHDQGIAAANAGGIKGLKSPADVLGHNVSKQVDNLIRAKHSDSADAEHYGLTKQTSESHTSAKLNRIDAKKVEGAYNKYKAEIKAEIKEEREIDAALAAEAKKNAESPSRRTRSEILREANAPNAADSTKKPDSIETTTLPSAKTKNLTTPFNWAYDNFESHHDSKTPTASDLPKTTSDNLPQFHATGKKAKGKSVTFAKPLPEEEKPNANKEGENPAAPPEERHPSHP